MKMTYKIILLTVCSYFISCTTSAQDEKLTEAEAFIEELYNKNFSNWTTEAESKFNTIQLYRKIEDFYLSLGILDGIKKNNYQVLYKKYMQTDSSIYLPQLYDVYPEIESLESPSNITINIYVFGWAMDKYANKISNASSLYKVSKATIPMQKMDYVFEEEEELFRGYMNSIKEEDFEGKLIYRIPLIAFSHAVFVSRYFKKREDIKKSDHR